MTPETVNDVVGVVLAGGLASRMGGGDKGLLALGGRPVLDHVLDRLRPQVRVTVLNANGAPERFARWGLPVAADVLPGNQGPLAGVLTGMDWAVANLPGVPWIVTVPTDTPFLPRDLVARFLGAVKQAGADMACAVSAGQRHPVVGLWPVRLRNALRNAMLFDGVRKVDAWMAGYAVAEVAFDTAPVDPLLNVNEPGDLDAAERALAAGA
jgi:molybdopterin-guanine dinucleotide biosynthesis protein A